MHPPLYRPHPKCAAVRTRVSARARAPAPRAVAHHHPSRARRNPPARAQLVDLLVKCHDENPYGKFWGACNDQKAAMDWCFKEEKEEKRRANFEKTRSFNEEWRKKQDAREVGR